MLCLVSQSRLTLCKSMDYSPTGSSVHGDSPGKNTRVGCHALLQGIFPTQGSNPGLPHCKWILYQLSHKGSPSCWNRACGEILNEGLELCDPLLTPWTMFYKCSNQHEFNQPIFSFCYHSTKKNGRGICLSFGFLCSISWLLVVTVKMITD